MKQRDFSGYSYIRPSNKIGPLRIIRLTKIFQDTRSRRSTPKIRPRMTFLYTRNLRHKSKVRHIPKIRLHNFQNKRNIRLTPKIRPTLKKRRTLKISPTPKIRLTAKESPLSFLKQTISKTVTLKKPFHLF